MYRINYNHPISGNSCSRAFKTLKAAYRFIRSYSSSITFEVIPIGTSETYYVNYDLKFDEFITNSGDDQIIKKIGDINE